MCFGGGGNAGDAQRQLQEQQQQGVAQGLGAINQSFAGFTPQFYQNRAQAYEGAALPAFQQQYQKASNDLTYRLADQGLTKSSAASDLGTNLSNYATQQQQQIAGQGLSAAQSLEQQVNQNKSQLISQLEASYDPTAAAQQATASASAFAAPSPFPAVGNFFSDWLNVYGAKQAAQNPYLYYNQSFPQQSAGAPLGQTFSLIGG